MHYIIIITIILIIIFIIIIIISISIIKSVKYSITLCYLTRQVK